MNYFNNLQEEQDNFLNTKNRVKGPQLHKITIFTLHRVPKAMKKK